LPRGSTKKKSGPFDLQIQDMVLRIAAPDDLYEEARAAGLHFWEQVQSYGIRDPAFRLSKRPVAVPDDAPDIIREMARAAASAGVGPSFTVQGAITDHVGRFLAGRSPEVLVANGGDYFVVTRKRARLGVPAVTDPEGQSLAVVIRPELGPHGVFSTAGRPQRPADFADGLVVVATSCMLADAAAVAATVILNRSSDFQGALEHLQRLPGVHGAVIVQGAHIGVAGSIELAA
jgi:ApbE superfamily uncharacterized protein (UPF0280 family)